MHKHKFQEIDVANTLSRNLNKISYILLLHGFKNLHSPKIAIFVERGRSFEVSLQDVVQFVHLVEFGRLKVINSVLIDLGKICTGSAFVLFCKAILKITRLTRTNSRKSSQ